MDNPSAPPGKAEKYARVERERRWLMREAPDPKDATAEVEITDIYFSGTRLRLRRMVDRRGEQPTIYKLTQKVPGTSTAGLVTNTYLSKAEYELLAQLDGCELKKIRYSIPPFGIDAFLPPLAGLVLAEAEFEDDEAMAAATAPAEAISEVTDDPQFTGGYLAAFGLATQGPAPWD
jgi:CYTH domain-containing protein